MTKEPNHWWFDLFELVQTQDTTPLDYAVIFGALPSILVQTET